MEENFSRSIDSLKGQILKNFDISTDKKRIYFEAENSLGTMYSYNGRLGWRNIPDNIFGQTITDVTEYSSDDSTIYRISFESGEVLSFEWVFDEPELSKDIYFYLAYN